MKHTIKTCIILCLACAIPATHAAKSVQEYVSQIEEYLADKPETHRGLVLDLFWDFESKLASKDVYQTASFIQDIRR